MIKYYKLFDMLNRCGMKRTDLKEIISANTIAKLGKGENVNTEVIDKLCKHLNCQPGDIMEYVQYGYEGENKKVYIAAYRNESGNIEDVNIYPINE